MSLFEQTFDPSGLDTLAKGLRLLTGEQLGRAAIAAVNAVTTDYDRESRKAQNLGINLTDGYVSGRTHVTLATSTAFPRAEIRTDDAKTRMEEYDAKTLHRPGDLDKLGRRLGKRQAGVGVQIKRGEEQYHLSWFRLPLGATGKTGVFVRTARGGAKQVFGVAPYSLAKFQAKQRAESLAETLSLRAAAAFADAIEAALP